MNTIFNYIKIDDMLSTAGQPNKEQIASIAQEGFDVVLNLATINQVALKEEAKIVADNGMIYIHIPISWNKPEIDKLKLFFELFYALEITNQKVFIHCILNYRVSVFLYKYKRDFLGDENAQFIAPKRFNPNEVWQNLIDTKIDRS